MDAVTFEDPAALKRRLRAELRRLRIEAGYTQKDVAQAMDWATSKVIRIDAGSVAISSTDLRALLNFYGVSDREAIEELVATAESARKQTWGEYRDVVDQGTATFSGYEFYGHEAGYEFYGYEALASIIRSFQPQLIPGLLWTEEYSGASLRDVREIPAKNIERFVEMRAQRQELLDPDEPPKIFAIVDEAAIHHQVGGPAAMRRDWANQNPFFLGIDLETLVEIDPDSVDVTLLESATALARKAQSLTASYETSQARLTAEWIRHLRPYTVSAQCIDAAETALKIHGPPPDPVLPPGQRVTGSPHRTRGPSTADGPSPVRLRVALA